MKRILLACILEAVLFGTTAHSGRSGELNSSYFSTALQFTSSQNASERVSGARLLKQFSSARVLNPQQVQMTIVALLTALQQERNDAAATEILDALHSVFPELPAALVSMMQSSKVSAASRMEAERNLQLITAWRNRLSQRSITASAPPLQPASQQPMESDLARRLRSMTPMELYQLHAQLSREDLQLGTNEIFGLASDSNRSTQIAHMLTAIEAEMRRRADENPAVPGAQSPALNAAIAARSRAVGEARSQLINEEKEQIRSHLQGAMGNPY